MSRELLLDPSELDLNNVLADADDIRKYNPQRHEMEQLTAIIYADLDRLICAGYKDITDQEFWVRGHMPNMPLMPGVIMLEAAAQLCSYFAIRYNLLGVQMIGFGGLERVRFRDPVVPGDRLILMCQQIKLRRGRMIVSKFQGVVGSKLVLEGELKGIPIPIDALKQASS